MYKDLYELDSYLFNEREQGQEVNNEVFNQYFFIDRLEKKGEKTCNFIAFKENENEDIDKEIKRLQELKKKNEKNIKGAKNYLLYLKDSQGLNNFGLRKIQIRETEAVEVDNIDIDKVPSEFINTREVKTISKEKIKDFLNSPALIDQNTGEIIPNKLEFARIVKNRNVIIK